MNLSAHFQKYNKNISYIMADFKPHKHSGISKELKVSRIFLFIIYLTRILKAGVKQLIIDLCTVKNHKPTMLAIFMCFMLTEYVNIFYYITFFSM